MNVISEDLFNRIKQEVKVPTLPVQNCVVSNAIGSRVQRIQKQVLEVYFENATVECSFLVVNGFSVGCILGMQFLRQGNAVVDLRQGKCIVEIEEKTLCIDLLRIQSRDSKLCNSVNIMLTNVELCMCMTGLNTTDTVSINLEEVIPTIDVFSKKPGVIKGCVYHINVAPHLTYCCRTYSIPWSRKEEV